MIKANVRQICFYLIFTEYVLGLLEANTVHSFVKFEV